MDHTLPSNPSVVSSSVTGSSKDDRLTPPSASQSSSHSYKLNTPSKSSHSSSRHINKYNNKISRLNPKELSRSPHSPNIGPKSSTSSSTSRHSSSSSSSSMVPPVVLDSSLEPLINKFVRMSNVKDLVRGFIKESSSSSSNNKQGDNKSINKYDKGNEQKSPRLKSYVMRNPMALEIWMGEYGIKDDISMLVDHHKKFE